MSSKDEIRESVRQHYGEVAKLQSSCCSQQDNSPVPLALQLGYSKEDVSEELTESNLGLGCGNPIAIAQLKPGDIVLDLGSGAGFDCFLAAKQVGTTGFVIGVDMTPEMISKARENVRKVNFTNVEFRLGEIEHLPVGDTSIDVIISNCVINLSPDKPQVFKEAFRVLKTGGRLTISDIVARAPLPEDIRNDISHYTQCVSGASSIDHLQDMLAQAGFTNISIMMHNSSREFIKDWSTEVRLDQYIVSATIEATKPTQAA